MRKLLLAAYLTLSLGMSLTTVSWLTWGNSCEAVNKLIDEGTSFSGMCAGDGIQFVGVFVYSLIAALIYIGMTILTLKLLGLKITEK